MTLIPRSRCPCQSSSCAGSAPNGHRSPTLWSCNTGRSDEAASAKPRRYQRDCARSSPRQMRTFPAHRTPHKYAACRCQSDEEARQRSDCGPAGTRVPAFDMREPSQQKSRICAPDQSGGSVDTTIDDNVSPLTPARAGTMVLSPPRPATESGMRPRRALPRRPARRVCAVALSGTARTPSRLTQGRRVEHARRGSRVER
jgi:hypothetical protein